MANDTYPAWSNDSSFYEKFYEIAKNYPQGTYICVDAVTSKVEITPWKVMMQLVLFFVTVMVVFANAMVIAAVVMFKKLQKRVHAFFVSLAISDLLVGLLILPFSAPWEVFGVWVFGDSMCRIWLALDVVTSSASIFSLCAVSLDRLLAVRRPLSYQYTTTMIHTLCIIGAVYVFSLAITAPPIMLGKDLELRCDPRREYLRAINPGSYGNVISRNGSMVPDIPGMPFLDTIVYNGTLPPPVDGEPRHVCPNTCHLTNDMAHVLYTSAGSFLLPLVFLAYSHVTIYCAARKALKASKRGYIVAKGMKDNEEYRLRIHRGGPKIQGTAHRPARKSPAPAIETTSFITAPRPGTSDGRTEPIPRASHGGTAPAPSTSGGGGGGVEAAPRTGDSELTAAGGQICPPPPGPDPRATTGNGGRIVVCKVRHYADIAEGGDDDTCIVELHGAREKGAPTPASDDERTPAAATRPTPATRVEPAEAAGAARVRPTTPPGPEITAADPGTPEQCRGDISTEQVPGTAGTGTDARGCWKAVERIVIGRVARKIAGISKAGRTTTLALGSFAFCWCPFFALYIYRAVCITCVDESLFTAMFWLGYINSAINPVLYACLTPDFKAAFRCMWRKCKRRMGWRARRNRRNRLIYEPEKERPTTARVGFARRRPRRQGAGEEV